MCIRDRFGSVRDIRLWDVRTGRLRATLLEQEDSGRPDAVALAFSSDGSILATAENSRLLLWDVQTRRVLSELAGYKGRIEVLVFSPDSAVLVSGCSDGTMYLWDVDTGTLMSVIKAHQYRILTLKFSPDGATLVSGGIDSTILVWDWEKIAQTKK